MDLIILGSAAATPTKERNLSSIVIKFRSKLFLFDCGEDFQRRFAEANLKFNKPLKIFITHFHGDHIIGLPGFLFRLSLNVRTAPMVIYGPRNLFLYLRFHRKILGLKAQYSIKIIEIDHQNQELIEYDGLDSDIPTITRKMSSDIILNSKYYTIRYASVDHSVITYAYAFIEKYRYGKFNPERAKELGIPESYLRKKLLEGLPVEYKGRIINPIEEGIVEPKKPGRKITYSGDLKPCDSLIELGKDSDILIHEATFAKALADTAIDKKHSTSIDAASDAKRMNAKRLILTHISSRYQEDAQILLEEAKEIFPNTLLAKDLLKITLK